MKKSFELLIYVIHKALKKMRLSGIRNSTVHESSKLESGTAFVGSSMDRYSFCGYDCEILDTDIGPFCSIANGVIIGGGEHPIEWASSSPVFYDNRDSIKKKFSRHERRQGTRTVIEADVWIGRSALIKSGIKIGVGAVVGMGSVVTKDVPPYAIVGGNPARLLRYRFDENVIQKLLNSKWWAWSDSEIENCAEFVQSPEVFTGRGRG